MLNKKVKNMAKSLRYSGQFIIIILSIMLTGQSGFVAEIEIPSSFNPVGSGARAIGMGGAFIAVADDATAASWNPGGLIQLRLPEFSLVSSGLYREEDIEFGTNPEGAGSHSISDMNINYLSAVYPFNLFDRNMVMSLSYQHLYDFNREWQFNIHQEVGREISDDFWDYKQSGGLSAVGLAYAVQIIPELSFGFTLNFWDDSLTANQWEQKYYMTGSGTLGGAPLAKSLDKTETYSFRGFNANFGILWRTEKFRIGAVIKTPFTADIEHKIQKYSAVTSPMFQTDSQNYIRNEELEMPISFGIGAAYKFSDLFFMSADIYRTDWNNFVYKDEKGKETSPVSGKDIAKSDIGSTNQARIGFEYRFTNQKKGYIIPIRGGLFYDPAPAEKSPDDFYGFSLGTGFTLNDKFSLDFAYQYRFGNNVGSILEDLKFSQDVNEHKVYFSVIFYKF